MENKLGVIAVLGGTGHLGSALIHTLVNSHHYNPKDIKVFYYPNSPTDSIDDIQNLNLIQGDILDKGALNEALEDIDTAFHMIGNTTFDPNKKNQQWKINVEGTRNVLEIVKNSPSIKKLVYTSTVNTLGVPNPLGSIGNIENSNPYTNLPKMHIFNNSKEALDFIEKARTSNDNKWVGQIGIGYFDSKLAAQELVNWYFKEYDIPVVSVLPGTMFGPYDYLIGNGMYLISIYNNGMPGVLKGGLPLAHVMDVTEGHLLAATKGKIGERYICSGREEDNLYLSEMVKIVAGVIQEKNPGKKIKTPTKVFKPSVAKIGARFSTFYSNIFKKPNLLSGEAVKAGSLPLFYESKKAEAELGYSPKFSFRQAVADMYEYYLEKDLLKVKERYIDRR